MKVSTKHAALLLVAMLTSASVFGFDDDRKHEIAQLADATRNLPRPTRAAIIVQRYHFLYPSADFGRSDVLDLRERFASADVAVFYSHDSGIADEMVSIYNSLRAEHAEGPDDLSTVVGAQIISRNLVGIRKIAESMPLPDEFHLPDIRSNVVDESVRWQILRPHEGKLVRDVHSVDRGRAVIVVSNPLCAFSNAASEAIESSRDLAGFFSRHGLWIVPPARQLYVDEIGAWNRRHPSQRMVSVFNQESWPIIDDWATPVFYFVEDGHVVDKVTGWPKDGRNLDVLRNAVDRFTDRPEG